MLSHATVNTSDVTLSHLMPTTHTHNYVHIAPGNKRKKLEAKDVLQNINRMQLTKGQKMPVFVPGDLQIRPSEGPIVSSM